MANIRQATLDDLSLIVNWTEQVHGHEDDGSLPTREDFSENLNLWLRTELNNPNSIFLIAEVSSKPVGFIFASSVMNDNGFLEYLFKGVIQIIWVDEEHRHQRIAHHLLNEIEACFLSININYVECSFTVKNQLAKQFWAVEGFTPSAMTARKFLKAG